MVSVHYVCDFGTVDLVPDWGKTKDALQREYIVTYECSACSKVYTFPLVRKETWRCLEYEYLGCFSASTVASFLAQDFYRDFHRDVCS